MRKQGVGRVLLLGIPVPVSPFVQRDGGLILSLRHREGVGMGVEWWWGGGEGWWFTRWTGWPCFSSSICRKKKVLRLNVIIGDVIFIF